MLRYDKYRLGKLLAQARAASNLTQAEVSKVLGWETPQFLSNLERGISVIPLDHLSSLLELYNLYPEPIIKMILESQEREIRAIFQSYSVTDRSTIGKRSRNKSRQANNQRSGPSYEVSLHVRLQELTKSGLTNGTVGRFFYEELINEGLSHREALHTTVEGIKGMKSPKLKRHHVTTLNSIIRRIKGTLV